MKLAFMFRRVDTPVTYGKKSRAQDKRKITLIDLDSLIDLSIKHYSNISQEGRQKLPLKPVYFPAPSD